MWRCFCLRPKGGDLDDAEAFAQRQKAKEELAAKEAVNGRRKLRKPGAGAGQHGLQEEGSEPQHQQQQQRRGRIRARRRHGNKRRSTASSEHGSTALLEASSSHRRSSLTPHLSRHSGTSLEGGQLERSDSFTDTASMFSCKTTSTGFYSIARGSSIPDFDHPHHPHTVPEEEPEETPKGAGAGGRPPLPPPHPGAHAPGALPGAAGLPPRAPPRSAFVSPRASLTGGDASGPAGRPLGDEGRRSSLKRRSTADFNAEAVAAFVKSSLHLEKVAGCFTADAPVLGAEEEDEEELEPLSVEQAALLEAFDAAWLGLLNTLRGSAAGSVADVPLLPAAPWNHHPGYRDTLTGTEAAALHHLRESFPESRAFHTDHDLLRFLRARHFDMAATRKMYRNYCRIYRPQLLVSPCPLVRPMAGLPPGDLQLLSTFPQRSPALTAAMQRMLSHYVHTAVCGLDRGGRPVVYLRPADMLRRNMGAAVGLGERLALQASSNEATRLLCALASARAGYQIEEVTQVIDLDELSPLPLLRHMRDDDAQKEFQHNSDYAPETLFKVFIINSPRGSSTLWKVASVFLPPATRAKVSILGRSYRAELEECIGRENLPTCYGGKLPFQWPKHPPVPR